MDTSASRLFPVERIFNGVARIYDSSWLQSFLYSPIQRVVLAELRAAGARRILDVGCGTGILTQRLAKDPSVDLACGMDLSPGMLTQARARPGPHWLLGDAHRIPVRDGHFDAVISTQSFHFFDHPLTLREFRRVLAADGWLVIGMINPASERVAARLTSLLTLATDTRTRWPTQAALGPLLETAGFEIVTRHRIEAKAGRLLPTMVTVARGSTAVA